MGGFPWFFFEIQALTENQFFSNSIAESFSTIKAKIFYRLNQKDPSKYVVLISLIPGLAKS